MQLRTRKNDIPIALYRSLVAIGETGSFTEAAEELNLTQSAISAQMKRLQKLVGGKLFVKRAVGIGLSELGTAVEEYARRILTLNDQVMGMAGRASQKETIYLGIQSLLVGKTLPDVLTKCSVMENRNCQIVCGSAPYLTEKLRAGYVDMALMVPPAELRRNVLAEWVEKMVWVRAPHLRLLADNEPIPFIHREAGLIDRRVMKVLDEQGVPYRVVFSAADMGTLVAAAEAGMGYLVAPERVLGSLSDLLVVADERSLPKVPDVRAGVFHKEGFDLKRNSLVVEAFLSVVRPPQAQAARVIRRPAPRQAPVWPLRRTGANIHRS